jgi:hypothetical protein
MELGYGFDDFLEFERAMVRDKFATNGMVFVLYRRFDKASVYLFVISGSRSNDSMQNSSNYVRAGRFEHFTYIQSTALVGCGISGAKGCTMNHHSNPPAPRRSKHT